MAELTPEEFATIWRRFASLNTKVGLITARRHGLLAHYTSVSIIEQILRTNQVWLSNPLYMNDLQEMREGIRLAFHEFPVAARRAGGSENRTQRLIQAFNHYVAYLESETSLDTYVFCLCTHDPNTDGLLSMWREYGSRGNGAALVFNIERVNFAPNNPLIIAPVVYANSQERQKQLRVHLNAWVTITQSLNLEDDHLWVAALAAFIFTKVIALTTKHHGFSEEREVRVIYIPEYDPRGFLKPCLDYHIGPRGLEPKLKYVFGRSYPSTDGRNPPDEIRPHAHITDLLEFILLGPTISSRLAQKSFERMLERIELQSFSDRVFTSAIPLRSLAL
jgi:hypothetical protein